MRIINNSDRAGDVSIDAIDDEGETYEPIPLSLEAKGAAHFNSADLENGNPEKGLSEPIFNIFRGDSRKYGVICAVFLT